MVKLRGPGLTDQEQHVRGERSTNEWQYKINFPMKVCRKRESERMRRGENE